MFLIDFVVQSISIDRGLFRGCLFAAACFRLLVFGGLFLAACLRRLVLKAAADRLGVTLVAFPLLPSFCTVVHNYTSAREC